MEDNKILKLLRSGENDKVLDRLYEGFGPVSTFIKKNGGVEDEAKDIFQEALIIFYQKAVSDEFVLTSKISTYIYSVCRFLWKDKLKTKNRFISDEGFEIPEDINQETLQDEILENKYLDKVLKQLGDKCQSILDAYYVLKMSMKEIASKFDYSSVSSAKNQKYKCLERAKKMAKEQMVQHSKLV